MHYVKCLDISQVPEPTSEDVPRIIWVTSGELYADLLIAGEPLRIKISDIVTRKALPDNPRESAIYRHDDQYKYHTSSGWHTIATISDITDKVRNLTIEDLFNAVFDDTTGVEKLNSNVNELILLLAGESGLVSRITAVEQRAEDLYQAIVVNGTDISEINESISSISELTSTLSSLIDDLSVSVTDHTTRLGTVETAVTTLQETTISGIVTKLSAVESAISEHADRLTALETFDTGLEERVTIIEQSLDGLLIRLENI